jgi:hypothetical protein
MRFVFGKRFVLAAFSLAFILAASGGSAYARSGADAAGTVKATAPSLKYANRLAGFLPPVGARATLPTHGKTLLELPGGILYADGHIITNRGVRRLTPWGAQLLWSKIRAIGLAAGLFRHNTEAAVPNHAPRWYQVCSGRDLIRAHVGTSKRAHPQHPLPPAQGLALDRIDTLFANATTRLPAKAWTDRTTRAYVPSHYDLAFDQAAPDPAKLPSPAREELAKYQPLLHHASQGLTTDQARALFAAFRKSGVKLVRGWGERNFRLPTAHPSAWGDTTTVLRFNQDVPGSDTFDHKYCKY